MTATERSYLRRFRKRHNITPVTIEVTSYDLKIMMKLGLIAAEHSREEAVRAARTYYAMKIAQDEEAEDQTEKGPTT